MSHLKDKYDKAHSEEMKKINEDTKLSDIPEAFVKLPINAVKDFFKTDIVREAEHDALDGKYNPPK